MEIPLLPQPGLHLINRTTNQHTQKLIKGLQQTVEMEDNQETTGTTIEISPPRMIGKISIRNSLKEVATLRPKDKELDLLETVTVVG